MTEPPPRSPSGRPGAGAPHASWDPDRPDILRLLTEADVTGMELLPQGSNYTFLVRLSFGEAGESLGVYKPQRGEAPLWDFPDGTLYQREHSAFLVSQALGWPAIPPTVMRDGPHGMGTVQLYVRHDPRAHYFTFGAERVDEVRRIALFDAITNNADRKGGHCLQDATGKVWSIDHGLTFHTVHKLRTVIWDFQGDPVPADLLDDLERFAARLADPYDLLVEDLTSHITRAELDALRRRTETLITKGIFPLQSGPRSTPWPPV